MRDETATVPVADSVVAIALIAIVSGWGVYEQKLIKARDAAQNLIMGRGFDSKVVVEYQVGDPACLPWHVQLWSKSTIRRQCVIRRPCEIERRQLDSTDTVDRRRQLREAIVEVTGAKHRTAIFRISVCLCKALGMAMIEILDYQPAWAIEFREAPELFAIVSEHWQSVSTTLARRLFPDWQPRVSSISKISVAELNDSLLERPPRCRILAPR